MKKFLRAPFVVLYLLCAGTAVAGQWSIPYGGSGFDAASAVQQTADGGFIVAGQSNSFSATFNGWIMKLNADGQVGALYPDTWQKTYGDVGAADAVYDIQQTADGGYIAAGCTNSFGVSVLGVWVLKLDAGGAVVWQKTYAGGGMDCARAVRQTSDGGYIVAGSTNSFGVSGTDAWLVKLDANGVVTWQKTYGGAGDDFANSVRQTSDGGYIVAGSTSSFGVSGTDAWLLKLDAGGNVGTTFPGTWQKTYGGAGNDYAKAVLQTGDGGYILAGSKTTATGDSDAWILKLDANGNVGAAYPGTWQRAVGGTGDDFINAIQPTADGGYIAAGGYSSSSPGMATDAWFLKLNADGGMAWQKTYGASGGDSMASVQQTADGGFVGAGVTSSLGVSGNSAWLLRLDLSGNIIGCTGVTVQVPQVSAYATAIVAADSMLSAAASTAGAVTRVKAPVDSTAFALTLACAHTPPTQTWMRSFGGTGNDFLTTARLTSDGYIIAAGHTTSFGANGTDVWVMKLDQNGNAGAGYSGTYQKIYTKTGDDYATAIRERSGGGYVVSGYTVTGPTNSYYWLMWLNPDLTLSQQVNFGSQGEMERASDIQETADGGYVVVGRTESLSSSRDGWLLRINPDASYWRKSYGGPGTDSFTSVHQTTDGGFIVGGSYSTGGGAAAWVLKLDAVGEAGWQKTYGSPNYYNEVNSVRQTADGGYIFAGYIGVTFGNAWVVKLSLDGSVVWQRSFGDGTDVRATSVKQTADGGYVVSGYSTPIFGGSASAWVMKLYPDGTLAWKRGFGGPGPVSGAAVSVFSLVEEAADGGYIVAGHSNTLGAGYKAWLLKLDPNGNAADTIACNSVALSWPAPLATAADTGNSSVTRFVFVPPFPPFFYIPTAAPVSASQSLLCSADNARYALEVLPAGAGIGRITSSPAGIDCGADCSWSFASLPQVTLTAVPDPGAVFAGWSGACSGSGPALVAMTADKTCVARFDTPVDFSASPTLGYAPLLVSFADLTVPPAPTSWAWDFGDTGTSSDKNPSHVYTDPGLYSVSLAVSLARVPGGSVYAGKPDYIAVAPCLVLPAWSLSAMEFQYDSTISGAFNRGLPVILLQAVRFVEDLNLTSVSARYVTLSGGYDCAYSPARIGQTVLRGSLAISGSVTVMVDSITVY